MSFSKENLELSSPTATAQHLICGDPYCSRISDPFTNRILCRCYHNATSSPGHLMPPNFPAALFHTPIHSEIPSPVSSIMQPNPSIRWDMTSLGAPYTQQNIDNIIRSQMYSYMHSGMDLNNGRRKNATRETTAALKAWLKEHRKNPYPTKAEKIMLAIITRMTLTQVSTWFANARRRLKKENKGEFSSDISFDNISTSSDDEDSTQNDTLYKTERLLNNETATPEHELPGYSGLSNVDIYNYASLSFGSNRPLTSTPIDHNMNNLPVYTDDKEAKIENGELKQTEIIHNDKEKGDNSSDISEAKEKDSISMDTTKNEKETLPVRPRFLPPLISKPKIWSISNIIGNNKTEENNNGNRS